MKPELNRRTATYTEDATCIKGISLDHSRPGWRNGITMDAPGRKHVGRTLPQFNYRRGPGVCVQHSRRSRTSFFLWIRSLFVYHHCLARLASFKARQGSYGGRDIGGQGNRYGIVDRKSLGGGKGAL